MAGDSRSGFEAWHAQMWFETEELMIDLPDEFPPEYTRESLGALEHWLLGVFPDRDSVYASVESRKLADRAARYIGETFIANYGGHWTVNDEPDFMYSGTPAVYLDADPSAPYCPPMEVTTAVSRRTGDTLVRLFDAVTHPIPF